VAASSKKECMHEIGGKNAIYEQLDFPSLIANKEVCK
jgi:hypothetical protein